MESVRVSALLRIGRRDFLEDFRARGRLVMNPLWYFSRKELGSERCDPNEGVTEHVQPHDITNLTIRTGETVVTLGPERFRGAIRITDGIEASYNMFCMTAITDENGHMPFDGRLLEFGDALAAVFDVSEFITRFRRAVQGHGCELRHGLVRYVDETLHSGKWGPFTKSHRFEHQREFRFVLIPGTSEPLTLDLGSLEDICAVGTDLRLSTGQSLRF